MSNVQVKELIVNFGWLQEKELSTEKKRNKK
jgi:hypothetical protein